MQLSKEYENDLKMLHSLDGHIKRLQARRNALAVAMIPTHKKTAEQIEWNLQELYPEKSNPEEAPSA